MEFFKSKYAKVFYWVCIIGYIFIMTTPKSEPLKALEEITTENEMYTETNKKVVDIMNTKETDVVILQGKIDEIRKSLEEVKKSEKYDEDLQNTMNTWSGHTDKVQSELIVELDARIDGLEGLEDLEKIEKIEKIKIDIEALRASVIEYPREQGDRLLEKLEE